ncbi:hypothetical protein CCUS01_03665 [Colletotrichum cuscutae]|uniref:Uncharacterized protein n=1 Tax=Colletotrichum cuscutae TaxID=1209917 RepID=A0AAI9Y586_9PEZI|nr:hypothetical protein CCUS01_03665 [Colletotrichum cuscutae]
MIDRTAGAETRGHQALERSTGEQSATSARRSWETQAFEVDEFPPASWPAWTCLARRQHVQFRVSEEAEARLYLEAQAQGITPETSVGVPGAAVSRVSRHARALVDSFTVLRVVSSTPQRTWTLEVDVDTTEDPVRSREPVDALQVTFIFMRMCLFVRVEWAANLLCRGHARNGKLLTARAPLSPASPGPTRIGM